MSYWYAVVVLISAVIALPESLQIKPTCSLRYAFHRNPRVTTQLAEGILSIHRGGTVSASMKYLCGLEVIAGLILKDRYKPVKSTVDLQIFPLLFEEDGQDISAEDMTTRAIEYYKPHISRLKSAAGFGCNYLMEHGRHKYLCLFKLNRPISELSLDGFPVV